MGARSENADHLLMLRGLALFSGTGGRGFYGGLSPKVAPGEASWYTVGTNERDSKGPQPYTLGI